jgi:DNA mismatch endonuclease (patch repair protein)
MVFPKYGAVLFANGCFWHGHDCNLFRWPQTRRQFWEAKIEGNRERDAAAKRKLLDAGWRIGDVWECALKGPQRLELNELIARCERWLEGHARLLEVRGI